MYLLVCSATGAKSAQGLLLFYMSPLKHDLGLCLQCGLGEMKKSMQKLMEVKPHFQASVSTIKAEERTDWLVKAAHQLFPFVFIMENA